MVSVMPSTAATTQVQAVEDYLRQQSDYTTDGYVVHPSVSDNVSDSESNNMQYFTIDPQSLALLLNSVDNVIILSSSSNVETSVPEQDESLHINNNVGGDCNSSVTAPTNSELFHGQHHDLSQPQQQVDGTLLCNENCDDMQATSSNDDPVRGRKRVRCESEWKQNVRKRLRNCGLEYTDSNGKVVERKQLKLHKCGQCTNKCNERLSDEVRQQIFSNFWAMADFSRQRDFICSHVLKHSVSKGVRRSTSYSYFFTVGEERIKVCKQVFMSTLNIGERMIRYTLDHTDGHGKAHEDRRGKHAPGIKKSSEVHNIVHDHIASFPALDSHYARARTRKKYLEATLNISKMYSLYVDFCKQEKIEPVLQSYYRHVFDTEFNLSFHKPKKDYCTFCHQYSNSTVEEKEELQAEYEAHQRRKLEARGAKEKYKAEARCTNNTAVATFDLESVLPSPKLTESSVYYKRKLSTYNLTVYSLVDNSCTCYMWHEGTAGRGSSDIASCILKYLQSQKPEVEKVVLFSDTCSGQNRNQFFCAMVVYALSLEETKIKQVDHLYMESGHSQMECDSVHACVEREVRKQQINGPTDYYAAVRTARKPPYEVICMDTDDFKDFRVLCKSIVRNRTKDSNKQTVNWLKIKHFRYLKDRPHEIFIKYDTDTNNDSFHTLIINQGSRGRRPVVIPKSLPPLYSGPVPISSAKYKDLLSLCSTKIIHKDYHAFYKTLIHDDKIEDCLPDTDVDDDHECDTL